MLPSAAVRSAALGALAVVACGGREPIALDLSGAEHVIEYRSEQLEVDRSARITFEPIRRYGAGGTGSGLLYRPVALDVDAAGNVHVLDNGNMNIVVFGPDGEVLRTMGREGQGPGEIMQTRGIAVTGGVTFAIVDRARLAAWDNDGELLLDVRLPSSHTHLDFGAFDDGTLIASYTVSPRNRSDVIDHYVPQVILAYDAQGALIREYAVTPRIYPTRDAGLADRPSSIYAIDRAGRLYVSDGATYEVVAIDADGSQPWRLHADLAPMQLTEADIDRLMRGLRIPGTVDDFSWPDVLPSLAALKVDGHGHLYVYRYMRPDPERTHRIVDVFNRRGEHLFSGTQDSIPWRAAYGDLVYAFADDEASGGRIAVAYRLIEPFN